MHNPARYEGESLKSYRERQAQSRAAVRSILAGTRINPRTVGSKPPSSTDRERAHVKAERPVQPQAKPLPERTRRQHSHPLRDGHGAYTCVGPMFHAPELADSSRYHDANNGYVRRKWLAGISAQRGY